MYVRQPHGRWGVKEVVRAAARYDVVVHLSPMGSSLAYIDVIVHSSNISTNDLLDMIFLTAAAADGLAMTMKSTAKTTKWRDTMPTRRYDTWFPFIASPSRRSGTMVACQTVAADVGARHVGNGL